MVNCPDILTLACHWAFGNYIFNISEAFRQRVRDIITASVSQHPSDEALSLLCSEAFSKHIVNDVCIARYIIGIIEEESNRATGFRTVIVIARRDDKRRRANS
jgi:hypothetical protein